MGHGHKMSVVPARVQLRRDSPALESIRQSLPALSQTPDDEKQPAGGGSICLRAPADLLVPVADAQGMLCFRSWIRDADSGGAEALRRGFGFGGSGGVDLLEKGLAGILAR